GGVWFVGGGAAVWAGPFEYAGFGLAHFPRCLMFEHVVVSAQAGEISCVGRPAVLGVNRVVDVAPLWSPVAARESTSPVSISQVMAELFARAVLIDGENHV